MGICLLKPVKPASRWRYNQSLKTIIWQDIGDLKNCTAIYKWTHFSVNFKFYRYNNDFVRICIPVLAVNMKIPSRSSSMCILLGFTSNMPIHCVIIHFLFYHRIIIIIDYICFIFYLLLYWIYILNIN